MSRACWFVLALEIAIVAFASVPSSTAQERKDFSTWDDKKLREAIASKPPGSEEESQLVEISRRGGEEWKKFLVERIKVYLALRARPDEKDGLDRWLSCDLNLS